MQSEIKEAPIQIEALARAKNKKWIGNKKADVVACCNENPGWCEEVKCHECGNVCYHTPTSMDMKIKNIKMLCVNCILGLEKYKKYLNEDQIKILKMAGK